MVDERPFEDVRPCELGFSIPELKWRELLFVGALRAEGEAFVRDVSRPLPLFAVPDLFPAGVRFRAHREGARVRIERISGPGL
jgi:hypothetical protein